MSKNINILNCLRELYSTPGYNHPLGLVGHYIGILCLLSFIVVILPLFVLTWISSKIYFWFYRQKWISPKPYFNFDRHKIKYFSFFDMLGCEYCEFANGTLQWSLAITNEVERRWCPIKNNCDPHCEKVKEWRKDFLKYDHSPEELKDYYKNRYLEEGPEVINLDDEKNKKI